MAPFDGDPGGFAPPPGAIAMHAFRRATAGQIDCERTYRCPQDIEAVGAHYAGMFKAAGLAPMHSRTPNLARWCLGKTGPAWL